MNVLNAVVCQLPGGCVCSGEDPEANLQKTHLQDEGIFAGHFHRLSSSGATFLRPDEKIKSADRLLIRRLRRRRGLECVILILSALFIITEVSSRTKYCLTHSWRARFADRLELLPCGFGKSTATSQLRNPESGGSLPSSHLSVSIVQGQ